MERKEAQSFDATLSLSLTDGVILVSRSCRSPLDWPQHESLVQSMSSASRLRLSLLPTLAHLRRFLMTVIILIILISNDSHSAVTW